jgi:hypothetical protein
MAIHFYHVLADGWFDNFVVFVILVRIFSYHPGFPASLPIVPARHKPNVIVRTMVDVERLCNESNSVNPRYGRTALSNKQLEHRRVCLG